MPRVTNVEYVDTHFVYGLAMENLSLQRGYMSINVRIGNYLTDVYSKGYVVMWAKQLLSWTCWPWSTQCAGWEGCVGCRISQHSSHFFCNRTTFTESSMAYWVTVHSTVLFTTNARVAAGANISIYSFFDSATQDCTPLSFCAVARHEGKSMCYGSSRRSKWSHSCDYCGQRTWTTIFVRGSI
jgi:hypothetical protein